MMRRSGSQIFIRRPWFCGILVLLAGGFTWIGLHEGVRQGQTIMMCLLAVHCMVLAMLLAIGAREREVRFPIWTESTGRNVLMVVLIIAIVVTMMATWLVLLSEWD